jgi:cytochrome c553
MFSKNELKLAYGLIIYFLFVGVLCYAAFPPQKPAVPNRIKYEVTAGNVIFNHKQHYSADGFALSCGDCHHTLAEDEYDDAGSCSECHSPDEGDEEVPKLADAFHRQCGGCHEAYGAGPPEKDCTLCHVR